MRQFTIISLAAMTVLLMLSATVSSAAERSLVLTNWVAHDWPCSIRVARRYPPSLTCANAIPMAKSKRDG